MKHKQINEQEREKKLTEAINYFESNNYSKELIAMYQKQLREVTKIVDKDKKKREAFIKSLKSC